MATVDKALAERIIAAGGHYEGDPRVMRVVEYTNFAGNQAYGIEYSWEVGRYAPSQYVINPKVIWQAKR